MTSSHASTTHLLTYSVDGTPELDLRNHRGDIRVVADAAPGEVSVSLRSQRPVDYGPIEQRVAGERVTIVVPPLSNPDGGRGFSFQLGGLSFATGDHGPSVDIEVQVPPHARVSLSTGAGDIDVQGPTSALKVKSGAGDLRVEQAGSATLTTGSGDVRIERLEGGHVRSGTGDVAIASCTGTVDAGTGIGDIRIAESAGQITLATGAGDVTAYVAAGKFEARTGAGDVNVQVPTGVPVWRDLTTGLGESSSRIEQHGEPDPAQDFITVVARSGAGDVTLTH